MWLQQAEHRRPKCRATSCSWTLELEFEFFLFDHESRRLRLFFFSDACPRLRLYCLPSTALGFSALSVGMCELWLILGPLGECLRDRHLGRAGRWSAVRATHSLAKAAASSTGLGYSASRICWTSVSSHEKPAGSARKAVSCVVCLLGPPCQSIDGSSLFATAALLCVLSIRSRLIGNSSDCSCGCRGRGVRTSSISVATGTAGASILYLVITEA